MYLEYNNIVFEQILTKEFEATPVNTKDDVCFLYTHVKIKVAATFNTTLDPTPTDEKGHWAPAQTWDNILYALQCPRKNLIAKDFDGGYTFIDVPKGESNCDANNGPKPRVLSVQQFGPTTWLLEWEVETWLPRCCTGSDPNASNLAPYISNRWEEHWSYNDVMQAKRVRTGRLYFRTDYLLLPGPGPDVWRDIIGISCPPLANFLRQWDFTISSDGTGIDYVCTDQEQYRMPPPPAVKWTATFTHNSNKGTQAIEEMTVDLWGDNNTPKLALYSAASAVVYSRLRPTILGGVGLGGNIDNARWDEDLHANHVRMTLKMMKTNRNTSWLNQTFNITLPGTNPLDLTNTRTALVRRSSFGLDPTLEQRNQVIDPTVWGTNTRYLGVIASIFCDPCIARTNTTTSGGGTTPPPVPRPPGTPTPPGGGPTPPGGVNPPPPTNPPNVRIVPELPRFPPSRYNERIDFNLLIVEQDIDYVRDEHTLQLPVCNNEGLTDYAIVAAPTMRKVVTFNIQAWGNNPPQIPKPQSNNSNEVLLRSNIVPRSVTCEADGFNKTWIISGKYVYGIIDPSLVQIYAGVTPGYNLSWQESLIPASKFVDGLSSSSSQDQGPLPLLVN